MPQNVVHRKYRESCIFICTFTHFHICTFAHCSKLHHKGSPLPFYRLHLYVAFMQHHDLFAKA